MRYILSFCFILSVDEFCAEGTVARLIPSTVSDISCFKSYIIIIEWILFLIYRGIEEESDVVEGFV